jgi:hypothetical protein
VVSPHSPTEEQSADAVNAKHFAAWLSPAVAVGVLEAKGYTQALAVDALLRRLSAGVLVAAAEHCLWQPVGQRAQRVSRSILPSFHWRSNIDWLANASLWRTGDVDFAVIRETNAGATIEGRSSYFGVRLDPSGVAEIVGEPSADALNELIAPGARKPSSGRNKTDRWSPWIAELVAYVHDDGIPAGVGSQGQEEIIQAVNGRFLERGEETLARATVQPVVQAVLDRLRKTEK